MPPRDAELGFKDVGVWDLDLFSYGQKCNGRISFGQQLEQSWKERNPGSELSISVKYMTEGGYPLKWDDFCPI